MVWFSSAVLWEKQSWMVSLLLFDEDWNCLVTLREHALCVIEIFHPDLNLWIQSEIFTKSLYSSAILSLPVAASLYSQLFVCLSLCLLVLHFDKPDSFLPLCPSLSTTFYHPLFDLNSCWPPPPVSRPPPTAAVQLIKCLDRQAGSISWEEINFSLLVRITYLNLCALSETRSNTFKHLHNRTCYQTVLHCLFMPEMPALTRSVWSL